MQGAGTGVRGGAAPMARRLVVAGLCAGLAAPAQAIIGIDQEDDVADLLVTPRREARDDEAHGRRWAVLPQVGYGPDSGPLAGVKLAHRDLLGLGVSADADVTYSLNQQIGLHIGLGAPHLLDDRFLLLFRASYDYDPQRDFFGIGNNDVGPDPASTHGEEDVRGDLTLGWRPFRGRLALTASVGLRYVDVKRGDRDGDTPLAVDAFDDLPGVDGGFTNPLGLALVYNGRDDLLLPTRGWRLLLEISHTNRELESDFEFHPHGRRRGLPLPAGRGRAARDWRACRRPTSTARGPTCSSGSSPRLGGDDTLRGFFPRRFLGQSHVLLNLEYRALLFAFDFFDVWRVHVGGVVFGDAGRVFIDDDELNDEFDLNDEIIERIVDDFRYSYGAGVRFILSKAIVARVDVGFSEEETALVYLEFGHTF